MVQSKQLPIELDDLEQLAKHLKPLLPIRTGIRAGKIAVQCNYHGCGLQDDGWPPMMR